MAGDLVERLLDCDHNWHEAACTDAAARIAALEAEVGRLKALVIGAFDILNNCGALSGVCCCGEDMETHSSPMFAGHSPVDQGAYAASYWLETARAALERTTHD
jgi:hypothetical protein